MFPHQIGLYIACTRCVRLCFRVDVIKIMVYLIRWHYSLWPWIPCVFRIRYYLTWTNSQLPINVMRRVTFDPRGFVTSFVRRGPLGRIQWRKTVLTVFVFSEAFIVSLPVLRVEIYSMYIWKMFALDGVPVLPLSFLKLQSKLRKC